MNQSLHALDPMTWLETVWTALHGYRDDCIPEGEPTYDDHWSDICSAMAWIEEELLPQIEGGEND